VPVAGLLSGGIDSSLVIAAQRRVATTPPRTFSVRFPDARHDETAAAWRVAAHCETAHETVDGDDRRLTPDAILDLLRHFDQPFADTSCFPMYWVASAVRDRGIICALSGDGGDEAFGGYARFWRANRLAALLSAPGWLLGATARAGRALTGWTRDLGRQMARASQLALDGRRDTAAILAGFANYLTEDQKAALVRPEARQGLLSSWRHFNGADPVAAGIEDLSSRMTNALFAVSLPSDMLRKVDMMSMRASVEVRVPLLDEELVALGLTLPHRLKTDGRSGKVVLRALAAQWLPAHIARRPKHGFDVPLDLMVPDAFHAALWDLLGDGARSGTFLNQNLVRQWVHAFTAGRQGSRGGEVSRGGLHWRVFMALSLELWLRDHSLSW
jgi:asparagine synthase (glutamine-hydrolysing)